MAGEVKRVGRPRVDDPKMKFDLRLRTSVIIKYELLSEKLGKRPSELVELILNAEVKKYEKIFSIEDE